MKNLVWIVSYPRSGNTWFRLFLSAFMNDSIHTPDFNHLLSDPRVNSREFFDEMAGVNSSELTRNEIDNLKPALYGLLSTESKTRIYVKTHERFFINNHKKPVFPPEITVGCVYIIRNPLDVVISNAHFFKQPVDEIIDAFNNPENKINQCTDHVLPVLEEWLDSWSAHEESWTSSGLPVHVMRYEDMVSDPLVTFRGALQFLEIEYTDDQVLKALEVTAFEKLKEAELQSGFRDRHQNSTSFFRKGSPGEWKDVLTVQQINRILHDHGAVMNKFGYPDQFPEMLG